MSQQPSPTPTDNNSSTRKKFIIFDMGGVLISTDFNNCLKTIYNENQTTFQQHQPNATTVEDLLELVKKQFSQYKIGAITEDQFWGVFFEKYFNHQQYYLHGQLITLEYLKEQFRKEFIIPFYNGLALVEEIRDKQKKNQTQLSIGIMSNHSKEWFPYCVERWKLDTLFVEPLLIVNSSDDDVQCGKPKLKIMEQLMNRIKKAGYEDAVPSDIAFIDDKQANVDAAIQYGMKGICWHGKKQHLNELIQALQKIGFLY
ncbi:hypothetical protein C9374_007674 [Naegleria lovaniensis]|uniref:Uncharacterized protein n=1 Tax=Naegleria lovaniensis TaxID=51637 RepID=A0AA88GKY1_NAELO|nr:uncharacterized protein C9374_007674 [Naegleria lovaniensis]KAG2379036.1 hypothetical protein C9374_007674 [Naegleria lovaniensis]